MPSFAFLRTLFEVSLLAGLLSSVVIGANRRQAGILGRGLIHGWTWSDMQAYRWFCRGSGKSLLWYHLYITSLVVCFLALGLLMLRGCHHARRLPPAHPTSRLGFSSLFLP